MQHNNCFTSIISFLWSGEGKIVIEIQIIGQPWVYSYFKIKFLFKEKVIIKHSRKRIKECFIADHHISSLMRHLRQRCHVRGLKCTWGERIQLHVTLRQACTSLNWQLVSNFIGNTVLRFLTELHFFCIWKCSFSQWSYVTQWDRFKDSCCHGLERKDSVRNLGWPSHSGTAAAREMMLMKCYSSAPMFMYVVSCESVSFSIVQSAHSKLCRIQVY